MDAKKKMPVKKTGRKHFKNYAVLDGVSVTDMTKEQLEAHVYHLQQEIEKEKEERNCFQIERDRIQSLWEITKQQLEEKDTMLRLKDNEIDEAALSHLAEIKLYKQKMKHIMFECEQLVNEKIVEKMVEKLALEEAYKTQVDCLENDIKKLEGEILQLKTEHSDAISNQKLEQEKEKQALHQYYQKEIDLVKNEKVVEIKKIGLELDLQRRQAIEEIEKQKDCHMKQLIQTHENLTEKMKN
ncbi:Growth arrest-specific protein 8, partial [Stegodyphus mimosarum]